jgi:4-amino-4-deoxy-L-arabinose transferase-like glycosyltransferase
MKFSSHLWKYGYVLPCILLAGLLLRLAAVVWFTPPLFSDDLDYVALGRSIVHEGSYQLEGRQTAYRPPGYPMILAGIFASFGDSLGPVRVVQALADTVSCFLLFLIGRKLFSPRVGLIAAGIFALFPAQILYVSILMTETLFTTLLLLFLWLCADDEVSWRHALIAGVVLGIGTLMRPTILLMPLCVFTVRWLAGGDMRKCARLLAVMGVMASVVLLPWLVRNYMQFGRVTLTSNTGVNFWMGNHAGASGAYSYPEGNPLRSVDDEFGRSDLGIALGMHFIRSNPVGEGVILAKKWAHFFSVDYWLLLTTRYQPNFRSAPNPGVVYGSFPAGRILAVHLPFACVLLLGTFGFLCHAPGDRKRVLFLLSVCAYWLAVHLVFFAEARFRFPIVPLLMIVAAFGVDLILRRAYVWTRRRVLVFSFFSVLFIGGWVAERVVIHMKTGSFSGGDTYGAERHERSAEVPQAVS